MMIIDKILEWARGRGYTAVYGSAGQVNEMLTNVDFAASEDAKAVVMHLVTDSATVDGKDTAVVAVYFASLCDLDFDGEALLPEQERLKGIGKELLNDIRTGNEMTYKDPRWQYGYDDYAENVCWVCLRVTLTASAADCVPLSPEPPTPPPTPEYDLFCPQVLHTVDNLDYIAGLPSPLYHADHKIGYISIILDSAPPQGDSRNYVPFINNALVNGYGLLYGNYITNQSINTLKSKLEQYGHTMTEETESWLIDNSGKYLLTRVVTKNGDVDDSDVHFLAAVSATRYGSKQAFVYHE